MSVSVITAALPERAATTLPRALASVRAQTLQPHVHLVGFDHARAGGGVTRNLLLDAAPTEWIACLDDDDELHPDHLRLLVDAAMRSGADVVYSDWDGHVARGLPRDFDADALRRQNFIPACALFRRSLAIEVGGYPDIYSADYGLWLRMLVAGATFERLPVVTWTYHWEPKQHPANATREAHACIA